MQGKFVITHQPVGSYNISVEYVGYRKVLKNNVVISSGKTTIFNVEMMEDVLETTGIEVIANYFQIPKEPVFLLLKIRAVVHLDQLKRFPN